MTKQTESADEVERLWHDYLTTGDVEHERRLRQLMRLLPGAPRCKFCYAPFHGVGSPVTRWIFGKVPSNLNPRLCNICEEFARHHQGGAEVELTLMFADVRGSTQLAESLGPRAFSELINRLYNVASSVIIETDGLIDKIIGDQVAAMYVPGFAGKHHAERALTAARRILRATGHGESGSPWIPLGAAVHTGVAFVGSVGREGGTTDITVLGDLANTAARLSSAAGEGEILIGDASFERISNQVGELERRVIELKGKRDSVAVHVLPSRAPRAADAAGGDKG